MVRDIEIFSAGCPSCEEVIEMVNRIACPSCRVTVHDLSEATVAHRAKDLGVRSTPVVVIEGELAACCGAGMPNERTLRAAGLGRAIG